MSKQIVLVGYLRVSTREQAEEGVSLARQKERIESFVDAMNMVYGDEEMLVLKCCVRDEGLSGRILNRPALAEVQRMVESGDVDGVVVADKLRLSRLGVEDIRYIYTDLGLVYSVQDRGLVRFDTPKDRLNLKIDMAYAEYEAELTSERTKEALKASSKRAGAVPYGREWSVVDGAKVVIDSPSEMKVVRTVKRWSKSGSSIAQICRDLDSKGHRPRSGGRWSRSSVVAILEGSKGLVRMKEMRAVTSDIDRGRDIRLKRWRMIVGKYPFKGEYET